MKKSYHASLQNIVMTATLVTGAFMLQANEQPTQEKKNLLIIHTDELSFRTLGCYRKLLPEDHARIWGKDAIIETPNIDWIGSNGVIFTNCYASSPVCTPSRGTFVSGQYAHTNGAKYNGAKLKENVVTFAEVLSRNGYTTGYAGKCHWDGNTRPGWAPAKKFGFSDNRYMFNEGQFKVFEDTPEGPRVKSRNANDKPNYGMPGVNSKSFAT